MASLMTTRGFEPRKLIACDHGFLKKLSSDPCFWAAPPAPGDEALGFALVLAPGVPMVNRAIGRVSRAMYAALTVRNTRSVAGKAFTFNLQHWLRLGLWRFSWRLIVSLVLPLALLFLLAVRVTASSLVFGGVVDASALGRLGRSSRCCCSCHHASRECWTVGTRSWF